MKSPEVVFDEMKKFIGKLGVIAFVSTFSLGLFTHLVVMTMDVPNHDGLASIYSDQNMLVSGRWLLGIACGISSYFSIPWFIGVLSLIYLGITSIFLCKILEVNKPIVVVMISSVLVTFPTLASNFAYVFTMDGYMLGLLFAILSVYFVDKNRYGFLVGAVLLCCSMGIYQAYLPIAMLLSLYCVLRIFCGDNTLKQKIGKTLRYLLMGVIGALLYYIVLKVMLLVQNESIGSYQMNSNYEVSLFERIRSTYYDFVAFSFKGNVLFANGFALTGIALLVIIFAISLGYRAYVRKWYRSFAAYICLFATIVFLPIICNIIMIITPGVTYHLLMRYQWAFLIILMISFVDDVCTEFDKAKISVLLSWGIIVSTAVMSFSFAISDNIAYSNLMKRYEKTYSYCLRLADRIEQAEGYYQGIPIYMIGVVGDDNYPITDVTEKVTGHMVGLNGDYLLYTAENYEQFYKNYMGITFNFLKPEEADFYYEDWYVDMPSFPASGSIKVVDGILCIKTENSDR